MKAAREKESLSKQLRGILGWLAPRRRETAEQGGPAPEPPQGVPEPSQKRSESGPKILVVDDDPLILKTFTVKLQKQGYRVVTANDGASAIGAVRDERPDLILLDIDFPPDLGQSWNGFQMISWLRGLKEAKAVPFIVITGGEPDLYKERALAAGAAAFFRKGNDFAELLEAIQKQLTGGRTG